MPILISGLESFGSFHWFRALSSYFCSSGDLQSILGITMAQLWVKHNMFTSDGFYVTTIHDCFGTYDLSGFAMELLLRYTIKKMGMSFPELGLFSSYFLILDP